MTQWERYERRTECVRLHAEGMDDQAIAQKLGVSVRYAHQLIRLGPGVAPADGELAADKLAVEQAANSYEAKKLHAVWRNENVKFCKDFQEGVCAGGHASMDLHDVDLPNGQYAFVCRGKLDFHWREWGFGANPLNGRDDYARKERQRLYMKEWHRKRKLLAAKPMTRKNKSNR